MRCEVEEAGEGYEDESGGRVMRWYVFDTRTAGSDFVFRTRLEPLAWLIARLNRHWDYWHTPTGM